MWSNQVRRLTSFLDRRSIRYPLFKLIVAAAAFAVGLALIANAWLSGDSVRRDIRRTLVAAANAAASAASAAVVFEDAPAAQQALQMFEAWPEIEAAALYSGNGARLASYGKPEGAPNRLALAGESI
ncbi:MAG: hypothetical protein N2690_12310, partial [Rhodocyclaceae bacterium]|nr:hypothetical protein [Rhodocyclaceae bacterium]